MKKQLLLFLFAIVASVGTMFAEKVQIGDLYYNLNKTDKTAEVTYMSYDGLVYNKGWNITTADIPASVTYYGTTYSVTSIGELAFNGRSSLSSVTIPNSVTSIGNNAFSSCSSLTSVTIPNSVTSIGEYAFSSCYGLTSVTLNSNTIVGKDYEYNSNIKSIFGEQVTEYIFGDEITSIGNNAFYSCSSLTSVTIPNSVTSIGYGAFAYCRGLTSVTIGNSVTSIGDKAFYECSSLTSVTIGNSVTSIGSSAFLKCSSLTSVTIPNSVTSIGDYVFQGCSRLTSVTIPNSVTSIGGAAFYKCSRLTSPVYNAHVFAYMPESYSGAYTIPDGIESIAGEAFRDCSRLTSVTIPNSVTSIGEYAFSWCSGLTSVTIPNSITSIGSSAFYLCSSLTSISVATDNPNYSSKDGVLFNKQQTTLIQCPLGGKKGEYVIPYSVTSIGTHAFYECSRLTSVTIPNSVTSIGDRAFMYCSGLTSVTLEAETPPTLTGSLTFHYTNDCPIYVPCKALNAYKTAWLSYANRIHGYCESITVRLDPSSCSGWSTVRLWAWTDAGNVFDAWPGQVVSKDKEGWYSYTFGDVASINIIWNNGIDQTVEIEGVTSSTCYALNSTTGTAITTRVVNCPDAVPTKYTIVFKNWDGSVLQSTQVEEGKMPQYTGTTPTKPSDSQYSYTFSGWTPQIVAASADATYTATYNSIGKNNITVRLDPSSCSGWSTVRLWAWTDAGNVFDAWPGQVVSKDKEGWYSYTFDKDVTSVNIIWNNGIDQTVDIEGVTSSTCYALNSTTGTAITAKVVNCPDAVPTKYTIVFKNWDGSVLQSTQVEEGKMPQYTGATPTKPNDAQYSYTFSGWTPQIVAATANSTYTATFMATKLPTDECDVKVTWLQTGGSGLGEITTDNSVVWKYDNRYGACAQAYSGATGWLLTPAKDLSNTSSVNLSFLHVHKNAGIFTDDMTLWVCADYKGSVDASQWQQLTISPYSANNDWVYVNVSIDVPLDMVGANTVFGFKYVSSNSSAKWEIKELHLNAECAKADETTITGVTATPNEDNSVTLTWPAVNGADTYTIEIKKNGVLVCTLVFNAYGQLISMNFATPARDGKGRNTAAAQEANGWMYVVTGLEGNSSYTYTITAKDANGNVLLNQSVDFRTDAHTELNAINESSCLVSKVLRNGEVLIIRGGKMYNLQGVEVK